MAITRQPLMMNSTLCQSCGTPLIIGLYGTNHDASPNDEYCKLCLEQGAFREPNLTLEEMVGRTAANMIDAQNMERIDAENRAKNIIPTLKRWKNNI